MGEEDLTLYTRKTQLPQDEGKVTEGEKPPRGRERSVMVHFFPESFVIFIWAHSGLLRLVLNSWVMILLPQPLKNLGLQAPAIVPGTPWNLCFLEASWSPPRGTSYLAISLVMVWKG